MRLAAHSPMPYIKGRKQFKILHIYSSSMQIKNGKLPSKLPEFLHISDLFVWRKLVGKRHGHIHAHGEHAHFHHHNAVELFHDASSRLGILWLYYNPLMPTLSIGFYEKICNLYRIYKFLKNKHAIWINWYCRMVYLVVIYNHSSRKRFRKRSREHYRDNNRQELRWEKRLSPIKKER